MRRKHIGFYLASVALSIGLLLVGLYLDGFFVDTGPEDSLLAVSERPGGEIQAEQDFNGSGSQPLSNQAEPDEPSPPPPNIQVAHRAPGLVKLEWDRAASPQSYQVIYWHVGNSNSEWIVLPNAGIQVEMDVEDRYGVWISQLPEHPDRVHHFAVRTVTDGNHSAWTETISTSDHFSSSPEPERQVQTSVLSVVNQESVFEPNVIGRVATRLALPQKLIGRYHTRESIVLDWEDVPGAHSYRVRVWDEARVGWSVLPTERFPISWDGSRAVVRFALDSFDAVMKSQLMFSVQAVGEGGRSSWTKPVGVPLVLDTPTGLFGQSHEGNRIGLDWQDVPLADFYEIRYRSSASPDSQWIMLSGATGIRVTMDGSSAYIDSLPGGDAFVFQVRAITGNYEVCSDWSEDMGITQSGEPGTTPGTEPGTTPGTEPGTEPGTITVPETSTRTERTSRPTPRPIPRPTVERTTDPNPRQTPRATPDTTTTGGTTGSGTGTDSQNGQSTFYHPERVGIKVEKTTQKGNILCVYIHNNDEGDPTCSKDEDNPDMWENGRIYLATSEDVRICSLETNTCTDVFKSTGTEREIQMSLLSYFSIEIPEEGLELAVGFTGQSIRFNCGFEDLGECIGKNYIMGKKFQLPND